MLEGAKSAIRDGSETLFWRNKWVDSDLRLIDFANTSDPDFDMDCTVASMVNNEGQWDYQKLEMLLAPEAVDVVAGMSPPQANKGEDDWVWGLESLGHFSIKTAYNLICETNFRPISRWWRAVWKWNGPNRIRHFLWLVVRDKLLTNEVRCQRGFSSDAICSRCSSETESILHILRDCDFAREAWSAVGGFETDGDDWKLPLTDWFQFWLAKNKGQSFGITCWFLWRTRNEMLFVGGTDRASVVAAKSVHWEGKVKEATCFEASVLPEMRVQREIQVKWQAGPQGWITVNSDGSVLGTRGKAAAGGILRQADGKGIYAYAINLGICSITRADIRGALEGIKRAWLEGYRRVEVQLDSQAAIAILLDRNDTIFHQHALEVFEFREWMGRDWILKLKHVYREANRVADYLANHGHTLPRGCHPIPISDCNVGYHARYDCKGISEPRLIN
ncbi:Putative ribonuclease H protein At1g65750 [Linum perenne]